MSATNNSRASVMAEIFAPELSNLSPIEHLDQLRAYARTHSVDGTLDSRHSVNELVNRLVCWMAADLGITDQQLFEHLSELAGDASDEYRSWSPNYEFPLTNNQVRDMLTYPTWDALVEALNGGLPESPEAKRLIPRFYVAFGEGDDCWLEAYSGPKDGTGPQFTERDFKALQASN